MSEPSYEEYATALEAGNHRRDAGLCAEAVEYEADTDKVVIAMVGGWDLRFERRRIAELVDASPEELERLALSPAGTTIELESHDVYISLEGLLTTFVPAEVLARLFGRRGGRCTSPSKAESARQNGRMGGRPKKVSVPA